VRSTASPKAVKCFLWFGTRKDRSRTPAANIVSVRIMIAICDRLEAQLETAQTDSRRLLESVLHKALAVA
jgi:hypothetical protein